MKRKLPFNAVHLRLFALAFMLLDHLWATVIPGNQWMTYVGRMAFPIFAFQIAEGYYHTSDFKRYAKRLWIFALISEIPFNLMMSSSWFDPFHQNVFFTMVLGLYGIRAIDRARESGTAKQWAKGLGMVVLLSVVGSITFVDYRMAGVLTVIAFGVLRNVPYGKVGQLIVMVLLHSVFMEGRTIPVGPLYIPTQTFAIFALVFIWLYNGEKGRRSRWFQYGSYVFYPAHMLILYLIRALW